MRCVEGDFKKLAKGRKGRRKRLEEKWGVERKE